MNPDAQAYIDAIDTVNRPLFDRVSGLVLSEFPAAEVVFSYKMPTYKVGKRRLYIGAWQHGISLYGVVPDRDGGFTDRHPELRTGKGTIRFTHEAAATIADADLVALIRAALDA
jgi:hypothetical protein